MLGDVLDDPLRNLGHVGERAARKSEQAKVDGEAPTIGWSTMATDDLEVAGRQGEEAAEVTFRQIGGNAHERVALFGAEQARCFGYHAASSM